MDKNNIRLTPNSKRLKVAPSSKRRTSLLQSLNGGEISSQETARHFARQTSEWQPKVFIKTFGCQMNVRDSEVIKGLLLENGFRISDSEDGIDAALFVTCSVRQHAEDKVWSEIGRLVKLSPHGLAHKTRQTKTEGTPRPTKKIVGLVGCMAENYKEEAFKRMPGIDLVVGPNNIGEIPQLLKEAFNARGNTHDAQRILSVSKKERDEFVYLPSFREAKDHSFVVISEGCDNFCSYCVVPYVRGRLRHRSAKDILKEIEADIAKGITSITLLGQNVNAYQSNSKFKIQNPKLQFKIQNLDTQTNFIALLKMVNKIKGLKEFGFVTSHPKDASSELFEAIERLDKLKKYLHLPVQSGSDRILKLMKRGYTRSHYLRLAKEYRKIIPKGELTTDIIVGFPSETEKDFEDTLDLVRSIRFNAAFIFKYSPRPHTAAAKLDDDVPKQEKERRHKILLETQKQISRELKAK